MTDWITVEEEQSLLAKIKTLKFTAVRIYGVVAKRRVMHFGWDYGYQSWTITPTEPIPDWLLPLRTRVADLMQESIAAVEAILVTCYEPGAGIGWHRDAPMFGPKVVGVSLLGICRMRFQRNCDGHRETADACLAPRSAYLLTGAARGTWQHSIPATKQWRYSLSFRTLKRGSNRIHGLTLESDKPRPAVKTKMND